VFSLRRADLMFFRFRRASFTRSKGFFALKEKTERRREMGEVRKVHKKKVPSSLLSLSKSQKIFRLTTHLKDRFAFSSVFSRTE